MFTSKEYAHLTPSLLGMDPLWNEIKTITTAGAQPKYPPHNVIKTEKGIVLEMAVAGWKSEDLSVTVENKKLSVSGVTEEEDDREYTHRGIGKRSFDRHFLLGNELDVVSSKLVDGILTIEMVSNLPEAKKIDIM